MKTMIRKACDVTPLVCAAFFLALFLLQPATVQGQWTTPDVQNNISNTNSGNVGVGTNSPAYKFDIINLLDKAQIHFSASGDSGGYLYSGGPAHAALAGGAAYNGGWIAKSLSASMFEASLGQLNFYTNGGLSTGSGFTPTARMTITSGGNVGIGTLIPQERLVTFGNMMVGNITAHTQLYGTYDSQNNMILEVGYGTATSDITPLPVFVLSKNLTGTNTSVGSIAFANSSVANGNDKRLTSINTFTDGATNSGALSFHTSAAGTHTERMRIMSTGRVGIGTSTPAHTFDVVGPGTWIARFKRTDNSNGGIIVESPTGFNPNVALAVNGANKWHILNNSTGSDMLQFWEATGSFPRFTVTQAGTVGIGTATPSASYKLDVQSGSINSSGGLCIAGDCKTAWSQVGGSQWSNGTGGVINYNGGSVGVGTATPLYSLDVNGGVNAFRTKAATVSASDTIATFENSSAIQMIVRGNGNIGVGNTAPTEKLHVTGNVKVTGNIDVGGNINAKYQDVAEWVDSSQDLAAGTVVVLDEEKSNQVIASTQSYDSRVAGVISLKPGVALGERGEGRVLVATTGRVKVKVDASSGPIKIGDLLVTSDKEGVAMKSVPVEVASGVRMHRPGTLIGKALEPLAAGKGEILVLLSLQ
jgi:hypothetical protein